MTSNLHRSDKVELIIVLRTLNTVLTPELSQKSGTVREYFVEYS